MIKVDRGNLSHLDGLLLSDTEFHQPRPIDMLLGADVWGMVVREGLVKGGPHKPCALATCFGWVVVGPTSANGVWDGSEYCDLTGGGLFGAVAQEVLVIGGARINSGAR